MKIAISSDGDSLESMVDQRFGRCRYFLIAELENKKIVNSRAVENQGAEQGHGAGIRAAQQLGELKVDAVLTGDLGPNATGVLRQLGLKSYHASGIVKDAVMKFSDGKLEEIDKISAPHPEMQQKDTEIKTERIFFPLLENNGKDSKISAHFGHAPFFGIYDVKKGELKIIRNDLDHTDPTKSPIDQIQESVSPTTIFAKDIGGRAIGIIKQKGLGLKTGPYETVGEAIKNIDSLKDQTKSCGNEESMER
ncbi:MAG: NifB/NifX family molybdenum-iron cluster-binding protein [Candidatus Aenigmarchaeota archaeon]|nr:NifB/NifX family molybdenum-iron cluster-binding protein [Candidatus Aenigmarchaeota archaeon]